MKYLDIFQLSQKQVNVEQSMNISSELWSILPMSIDGFSGSHTGIHSKKLKANSVEILFN